MEPNSHILSFTCSVFKNLRNFFDPCPFPIHISAFTSFPTVIMPSNLPLYITSHMPPSPASLTSSISILPPEGFSAIIRAGKTFVLFNRSISPLLRYPAISANRLCSIVPSL